MNRKIMILLAVMSFAVLVLPVTDAMAARGKEKRAEAYGAGESSYDKMMEKFYHPADWIELGGDFRARYVYSPHVDTLNANPSNGQSNWHYTRWRTRIWGRFELDENLDFNARIINEWRTWCDPDRKPAGWNCDEWLFDKFNLTWRNAFDMPLTLVFGRQDIALGHRWLVFEGTQNDGSRTIFFDAIRATYDWKEWDTKIDVIYVNNLAYQRNRIKPINDRVTPTNYEDDQGIIVYGSKKWSDKVKTDGYYIWKKDDPLQGTLGSAFSAEAEIHTLGGLVDGFIDDNKQYQYYVEAAAQTGSKDTQDMEAFGFNSKFTYHRQDEWQNCFALSYEFMTGDDPSTSKNEAFDPLWGTWPQWSELYGYTYSRETSIFEITNLHRMGLHWSMIPKEKWSIAAAYHLMWADENTQKNGTGVIRFDDAADFRGQLYTLWLKYNHNKHWKGHLVYEYFMPGAYYASSNHDNAMFLRLNIEYTF